MSVKPIIVEVVGGVVQAVYCDDPGVRVIIADWDNHKAGAEHLCVESDAVPVKLADEQIRAELTTM